MTREEGARILDPETTREALWAYDTEEERFAAVNEACRLGAEALRGTLTAMEGKRVWPALNQAAVSGYEIVGSIHDSPPFPEAAP